MVTAEDRSRRTLNRGVLVFRWVSLVWMAVVALTDEADFNREWLAWTSLGLAGAWTVWLTVAPTRWSRAALWMDLAVCTFLVLVSGLVVFEGEVASGRPFFATGYPLSAALAWGVSYGLRGGLFAGGVLGVALIVSRPLNEIGLAELDAAEARILIGGIINYLLAGGAVGIVSLLLTRSEEALQTATEELVVERERAARFAERESMARTIHDSVLQALAFIHKKARSLAESPPVLTEEVTRLSELAEKEERELRNLIMREPQEAPAGLVSLRTELEAVVRGMDALDVEVSSVGPIWLDAYRGAEVVAAVRQALANVAEHARANRTTVFAEDDGDRVIVSVRDDGVGFDFDERVLQANGKAGILKSIKGRIEDLGGGLVITSAPGQGTEIELSIPKAEVVG